MAHGASEEQIEDIVKRLKNESSTCIDEICNQIIKHAMDEIIEPLTEIGSVPYKTEDSRHTRLTV